MAELHHASCLPLAKQSLLQYWSFPTPNRYTEITVRNNWLIRSIWKKWTHSKNSTYQSLSRFLRVERNGFSYAKNRVKSNTGMIVILNKLPIQFILNFSKCLSFPNCTSPEHNPYSFATSPNFSLSCIPFPVYTHIHTRVVPLGLMGIMFP